MWNEQELETRQFLDALPIEKFLTQGRDLHDVMDNIQDSYGPSLKDDSVFQGDVFNWMSADEFADYLRNKGYYVLEDVTIRYTIGGRKDGPN